jgi:hypothetical protein
MPERQTRFGGFRSASSSLLRSVKCANQARSRGVLFAEAERISDWSVL